MIPIHLQKLPPSTLHLAPSGTLEWLVVLLLAALSLAVAWRAYTDTQPALSLPRRAVLRSLRALALLVLLLLLLEPILFQQTRREIDPSVLVLVDDSRSMGIVDGDGRSRLEKAREWGELTTRALRARGGGLQVHEAEGSRRLRREGEDSDGEGTNLPALLLSASQQHLEDNLSAVLLLSDGVGTDREEPSLAGLKVPVSVVAVGDSVGPGDLRLDELQYPGLVYRGESLEIQAEAVIDSEDEGNGVAVLRGSASADTLRFDWPAGGGRVPLRFVVDADSLGIARYELRLLELPGESLTQNNTAQLAFEVRKDRLRLVLVQSRPSWDFHFLHRRLAADTRFEVQAIYRRESGWGIAGSDSVWSPPRDLDAARDVDAWIVASLEDLAELSDTWEGLGQSVENGAGLLVLFGDARRRSLPTLSGATRSLLPVQLQAGARWVQSRYQVRPSAAGRAHPVLALPTELGPLSEVFDPMPPLWEAVPQLRPREDAETLLRVQADELSAPLLVVGPRGRGRVACWSAAPLWTWSFWRLGENEGEPLYSALIGNLVYFLAEGGERSRLQLVLPRPVVAQGEDAPLRAVVLDPRMQPDPASDLWLEWLPDPGAEPDSLAEAVGRARMEIDPTTPGGRRLPLPALPGGRYWFRVALEERGERRVSDWQALTVDPYSVEFREPGVDRASLARIARGTGGRVLRSDELSDWARSLALSPEESVRVRRVSLWASLRLFLPLLGLLSLEWLLRRRWGLV